MRSRMWRAAPTYAPWAIAGGPDPDFDDAVRAIHHAALTDVDLIARYRQAFPGEEHEDTDYDVIVRRLGYVWDCPADRAANVAGFRCAACRRTRAHAFELALATSRRPGRRLWRARDGAADRRRRISSRRDPPTAAAAGDTTTDSQTHRRHQA